MNGEASEILKLAERRVEDVFSSYYADDAREIVLLAAFEQNEWQQKILGVDRYTNSEAVTIANNFLKLTNAQPPFQGHHAQNEFGMAWELGIVKRSALVALAAAAIGASMGVAGAQLQPILVSVVGAEAAVGLNILSSLLLDKLQRAKTVDGLDLAVISVLRKGEYSASEIASRISALIAVKDVEASLQKLFQRDLVKEGYWPNTYTLTSEAP